MTSTFDFKRDDDERRVIVTVTGAMTLDVWAAALGHQILEGAWHYSAILDVTEATSFRCTGALDHMIAYGDQLTAERGVRGPVALVVTPQVLGENRRHLSDYAERVAYPFDVFTDFALADAWLRRVAVANVPSGTANPMPR